MKPKTVMKISAGLVAVAMAYTWYRAALLSPSFAITSGVLILGMGGCIYAFFKMDKEDRRARAARDDAINRVRRK